MPRHDRRRTLRPRCDGPVLDPHQHCFLGRPAAMKVICDRSALLEAVNVVAGVVNSRGPKPQLACIKLSASKEGDEGTLTLEATDGEVSVRVSTLSVEVK
ncbi:MAG TPA: hypothetical protein ENJ00_10665, partial [Phycisphaerales bacterium]|nr:hypothetical protein [Phycisphaerales bacterium]